MSNNNDLDYMMELISYMELRAEAKMKGIDVLVEVNHKETLHDRLVTGNRNYNYAVVKYIGGMTFTVDKDGEIYLDYYWDGLFRNYDLFYGYSFSEAKKIVENYNENIANMPKFYGFVRQYENETWEIVDYQVMALNYFAEKNGIIYETIFGCRGGYAEVGEETEMHAIEETFNLPGIDNTYTSCKKFFDDMDRNNGILCIAGRSRLDGEYWVWRQTTDIIEVDRVPYNHDNIMEYQEYKLEWENECIPENTPEQEYYIPEYGHNSIPGGIPECILEQEYDTGNNAPF